VGLLDPNIWFTGGNVMLARFMSRFLALQIAADVAGTPLQIYGKEHEQTNGKEIEQTEAQ
jgi:hypothetical protein